MNGKVATTAGAVLTAAFLAACSDSPMAPAASSKLTSTRPSFITVDQIPAGFAPEAGKVKVCKVWDNPGEAGIPTTSIARTGNDVTPTAATLTLTAGPYVLGHNQCANVATSTEGNGVFDEVTLTETVPANSNLVQVQRFDFGGATPAFANGGSVGFNTFHGSTIVFTNHFTPPGGCTYTKGWYRNHGANTITGVDGLTLAVEGAIFAATPGQPGLVTWNGNNNNLNLYQQLLAALENGGASGPAGVQSAINTALGGTSVSGYAITVTLTQQQVSALITTLSNFNEGKLAGFPHCTDEVLPS